ncbi:hypothetical protein LWI29_013761 [Acer saccharum]|uniref:Thaumatin-like protein n=1 Tax=Acer saccharum TaxID=4024 RepID=A0AA39S597_ACESA|nr:hypothetical protein LWI29_013761 [Acer saccharum]
MATISIKNNCPYTIWPGTVTGGSGAQLSTTGFKLGSKQTRSIHVTCNGAGAAPPASLVEFTIAANNGQDFYDVSLVDGFNLPVSVTPQRGSGPTCITSSCSANVNSVCPSELAVKGSDGSTIACKSACVAFNQPRYCCTGAFKTPKTCPPTNYSKIFKDQCPQAYSYAYDDRSSTFSCTGGANYAITFCP